MLKIQLITGINYFLQYNTYRFFVENRNISQYYCIFNQIKNTLQLLLKTLQLLSKCTFFKTHKSFNLAGQTPEAPHNNTPVIT